MPLPFAGNPIGSPFIELQSIDSTNKYAMAIVQAGKLPDGQGEIQHGMAVFAHEQTTGKGQRGKNWVSEKGSNIALSILLNPYPLGITEQFHLSLCIAVSVAKFYSFYAGEETKIKWPNDLYWRDRKAGGILIENIIRNNVWKWAVAGIGININQTTFPSFLQNPVSLKQITGQEHNPLKLANELCGFIETDFQKLINGEFDILFEYYQQVLYKKNEVVKLRKDNRVFETTIKSVSKKGLLVTQHAIEESFEFGQIEWVF